MVRGGPWRVGYTRRVQLHRLTFNPFQENTYVLAGDGGRAVVVDPGMSDRAERDEFDSFLRKHELELVACWLTHAHIDHVLGVPHVHDAYGLRPRVHPRERPVYEANPQVAGMYGMALAPLPEPVYDLADDASAEAPGRSLRQLLAPGHSPGSICFYDEASASLIGGDVLFRESIGRTDLPGGDHDTLLRSVRERVYALPAATTVWPGHGPETTIAHERANNPFVRAL